MLGSFAEARAEFKEPMRDDEAHRDHDYGKCYFPLEPQVTGRRNMSLKPRHTQPR